MRLMSSSDANRRNMNFETAVLAGGCFWGLEHLFKGLNGVVSTECGYSGGALQNPQYTDVKTGTTGHAEAVLIEFDPEKVSFAELIRFFYKIHDPTTRNRQGNDIGSQYRSVIFYKNSQQKDDAEKVTKEVNDSKFWKFPIVTEIVPFEKFFNAEDYHQDYLDKNPDGYTCHFIRHEPQHD